VKTRRLARSISTTTLLLLALTCFASCSNSPIGREAVGPLWVCRVRYFDPCTYPMEAVEGSSTANASTSGQACDQIVAKIRAWGGVNPQCLGCSTSAVYPEVDSGPPSPTPLDFDAGMISDPAGVCPGLSCQAVVMQPGAAACLQCAAGPCCMAYAIALAGDPAATPAALGCWAQHSLDASVSCSPPANRVSPANNFNACMVLSCQLLCDGDPYAVDAGL